MAMAPTGSFSTVKVFSCTISRERERISERVTAWLAENPALTPVDVVIRQSSDQAFHCFTIVLFLTDRPTT
jgi:exonuclease V gamma subunit